MDISQTSDLWWKNAVFYCLDVETFRDGNGDGTGDFQGLTDRIDYLAGLGVTCIWLMPFYPTANRDDGYDIIDYYAVDPRYGSLGDFVEFLRTASDRGIRVIADLVVNHTSAEHPWFKASRSSKSSPFRDWYVWQEEIPEGASESLVFPDKETSNWELDKKTGEYYLHRFYKHQPDLNIANPDVRDEIRKIIGFWLELGLSGFRVDAVPFLLETEGISKAMELAPHDWLRKVRSFLGRRRGDALLMGEVNLEYEAVREFFGDDGGDELHMCLNFNLNQAFALALVREDAGALVHSLRAMPTLPESAAWANFIRNHDEWSLDKLTEAERQEVFKAFGPKPEMQLFGRGLRRRLPTMLDGDQARLRMAYSLMFALPGAPVLFYGEEIGMAENLEIEGRMSVRALMQWSDRENGGFSEAPSDALCRPLMKSRKWGPSGINVWDQEGDGDSLLRWMENLIRHRREMPEIAFGKWSLLPIADPAVLALSYQWGERKSIVIHNLGSGAKNIEFQLGSRSEKQSIVDRFGDGDMDVRADGTVALGLRGYGYKWLRML
ncbi:alpha-amylase family protein [Devosia submarina]|uniref:alpha-amylase family protein n=1 Tax=Devosia submarina TaxID=1173082 RepID=UPI000D3615DE|nr:alpha-amylase family protein [Devosia submarina]